MRQGHDICQAQCPSSRQLSLKHTTRYDERTYKFTIQHKSGIIVNIVIITQEKQKVLRSNQLLLTVTKDHSHSF